jgi:hypothetical protein
MADSTSGETKSDDESVLPGIVKSGGASAHRDRRAVFPSNSASATNDAVKQRRRSKQITFPQGRDGANDAMRMREERQDYSGQ